VFSANDIVGWMVDSDSRPTFTELHTEFHKMSKDPGRYLVIPVTLFHYFVVGYLPVFYKSVLTIKFLSFLYSRYCVLLLQTLVDKDI